MSDENGKQKIAEYGSWSSPITSQIAVADGGLPFPCLSQIHTCVNANNEGKGPTFTIHMDKTTVKSNSDNL